MSNEKSRAMTQTPELEWLINAAYGNDCRERTSPTLIGLYSSAAESLWTHLGESFDHAPRLKPSLEVVHSAIARPTTFRNGQHETLVYDQYLGQIFNRLTSLTIEGASVHAVDQYMYRLYAQRAFVVGRFRTSALFGLAAKAALGQMDRPPQDPTNQARRGQLVAAQEIFVIGHELVHTCFSRDTVGAAERTSWYTDLMQMAYNAPFYHADFPDLSDRKEIEAAFDEDYTESIRSALRRRGIPDSDLPPRVRDPDETRRLFQVRERMVQMVAEQTELLEECVCDAFAVIATSKALVRNGRNPVSVASGAVLALHHLRLIQFLDRILAGQLGSYNIYSLSDFFSQAAARVSMLRTFISTLLVLNGKPGAAETIQQELIKINQVYATVVFDQVMHCMDFSAMESKLEQMPEVATSATDFETDRNSLKQLLGFRLVPNLP
jgi:hypothetical protein